MAWTDPATGPAVTGTVAPASLWNTYVRDNMLALGPHLLARKTADEPLTSNTTLQNDDHLVSPSIPINEVWLMRFVVLFTAVNGTGDIKVALTFPSGRVDFAGLWTDTAGTFGNDNQLIGGATSPTTARAFNGRGTTLRVVLIIEGVFANGGSAGALQLQWAQNTSNATATTIYTNSTLWGVKLA